MSNEIDESTSTAAGSKLKIWNWKLHWQILFALTLSALIAVIIQGFQLEETSGAQSLVAVCSFIGDLFMRALQMIVVPLIMASIIHSMIGLAGEKAFARLGMKTVAYYLITSVIAVTVGLVLVNVIHPGDVDIRTAEAILGQAAHAPEIGAEVAERSTGDLWDIFMRMIPTNIISAASDNRELLGIITFSLLYGFFATRLPEKIRLPHLHFWDAVQGVMIHMTNWIIRFAPLGVVGLVTPVFVRTGLDLFMPLMWYFVTVVLGLLIHFFFVLGLSLRLLVNINPWRHYKAMLPVLLTAFSTSSSASTLPLTMKTVEKEAGVSKRVSSFTLPLGATINMDGTALYECVVVIFIAQLFGVVEGFQLTLADQILVAVLALTTSIGVAGIPAASLVAIVIILNVVGLPPEAVALIWVTDRILDMSRTMVNVFSDTCAAVFIARSEGETTVYPD